jgi:hypothetical protein
MRKIRNEDKADNQDKETGGKQRERANIEMRQVGYGKDAIPEAEDAEKQKREHTENCGGGQIRRGDRRGLAENVGMVRQSSLWAWCASPTRLFG